MRGQALAIGVVIAGGVATLIMSLSTLDALTLTRDAFYRDYRLAHVFATLKRAPESLAEAIRAIPGVQSVETRVVASASLDVAGFEDPATGVLVSLPDGRNAEHNRLYLSEGRLPELGRDSEVVLGQAFASAHHLRPGDSLAAVINGHRQRLDVVGIAMSPEYIYQIKPGDLFPDFARHGVLWMSRTYLANAYDMDGAFNDVTLLLTRDARPADVIERLDLLLERYGGLGAIPRADQLSERYLSSELEQLEGMAKLMPSIFLGVAAFLLNVVLSRLIGTQRDQIAILKAFGYSHWQIGAHYVQWVLLILLVGLLLGVLGGLWLGLQMAELYREFFRLPYLSFRVRPQVVGIAVFVTLAAGLLGTLSAVRHAVGLRPAEAMRPEPPPSFHPTLVERWGLQSLLAQPARMVLRNLERRPGKALLSILGIAMACAVLMVGRFQEGALDYLVQVQYGLAQRDDLTVTFVEPTSRRALFDLGAMSGVDLVEPFRQVAVRLRHGSASYRTGLQGLEPGGRLRRVLDDRLAVRPLPQAGVVLSDHLATMLRIRPGQTLRIDVLEGRRARLEAPVVGVVQDFTGVSAYMDLGALNRLLEEGDAISGALLSVAPEARDGIVAALKEAPRVAGVTDRLTAIQSFTDSMAEIVLSFALVASLLAASIAFGVVYNNARIALTERDRELATLRVLGFSLAEIGFILLGELALLTLIAIPVGYLVGVGLIALIVQGLDSDLYRIPMIIEPRVYAFSGTVILVSALVSGALVARRLRRLDLVAVLKTRE
nr:FtsX-like permease family protein [Thiorhodococcus minor]